MTASSVGPRAPVWAVVPSKNFARGKSRLAPMLDGEARARFARSLLEHVLATLTASRSVDGILVATDSDEVAEVARAHGASVVRDTNPPSLAAVIDGALAEAATRGARSALVLMADLPELTPDDVSALVHALASADVVLSPDRSGRHTNALALSPPTAIATRFGSPTSFADHTDAARARGLRVTIVHTDGLAKDVDHPSDLGA